MKSFRSLTYHDTYDLDEFLQPGRNCLALVVHMARLQAGRAGLWAAIVDAGGATLEAAGPEWRCLRAPQWNRKMIFSRLNGLDPFQESYDARKEPAGWKAVAFDDSAWPAATVVAEPPWATPVPRDIPQLPLRPTRAQKIDRVEECTWLENRSRPDDLTICLSLGGLPVRYSRVENAEALTAGGQGVTIVQCSTHHLADPTFDGVREPCILLDFGKVITAYVELDLEGPEGACVDIGLAERLIDGQFCNSIEGLFAARYTLKAGRQTWRSSAWRGFRYLKLRFHECWQPLRVHGVTAAVTTFPFQERGSFRGSDPQLNAVFEMCRYTLRLCSNEFIMDTPWREQGAWLGDTSLVIAPGLYACFGDTTLTGKFMRQSRVARRADGLLQNCVNRDESPGLRVIPDYNLWWMTAVWNHYMYSGQRRCVEDAFPVLWSVLDVFRPQIDEHGLLRDMPKWVLIDWANVDRRGECAALNAIFVAAAEAGAKMADLLGEKDKAADLRRLAAGVRKSFVARFYDERRGVFADCNADGKLSELASEHTNATAILFGLCDEKLAADIIRRIYVDKTVAVTEATPFYTAVVLRALDAAGRFDLAAAVIRDRWGDRMVARGETSCTEEWGRNGSWRDGTFKGFMRTLSHAWSAAPAEFLIRNLAGIRILEPGCRKVLVNPRPADFDYDLTYPTPLGDIHVRRQGGKVTVEADKRIALLRDEAPSPMAFS